MLTKKTKKNVEKALEYTNRALSTNRLKGFQENALQIIRGKLTQFLKDYGGEL